ncbi:MAG: hypothetical protein L7W42_03325 [Alphaproteobacteria bacterium]|nr:hypothetical protein [Alphaproteobacteria bacterium]
MPILQNKLVWKSIEALHDEAVAAMPDAAIDIGIVKSRPTAILQQSAATQTPLKTAGGDDVMARIDQLLGKLDEDNDTATAQSAPPANDQTASTEIADEATATITQADDTAANVAASASAPDDAAADKQDDDPARSELVVDDPVQDEPVQSDPVQNDSAQALNDIAAAIHQAQQSQIDGDASPADPDLTPALDMAVLSATIADEVRHSVSAMIAAEMPQMVRQAVVEAIREMPTAAPGQPTPKAAKKMRAKPGTAKKTAAKKTPAKNTTGKKAVTKKATAKKAAS